MKCHGNFPKPVKKGQQDRYSRYFLLQVHTNSKPCDNPSFLVECTSVPCGKGSHQSPNRTVSMFLSSLLSSTTYPHTIPIQPWFEFHFPRSFSFASPGKYVPRVFPFLHALLIRGKGGIPWPAERPKQECLAAEALTIATACCRGLNTLEYHSELYLTQPLP